MPQVSAARSLPKSTAPSICSLFPGTKLYRAFYVRDGKVRTATLAPRSEEAGPFAQRIYGNTLLLVAPVVSRRPLEQLYLELEPPEGVA